MRAREVGFTYKMTEPHMSWVLEQKDRNQMLH